jgi:hypothetical protein
MAQFIFLTQLYNSCTKRMVFPIFPSLDKSSFPTFKQPTSLKKSQTVPTGPTDQGTLIWTASIKFEPLKLDAHK